MSSTDTVSFYRRRPKPPTLKSDSEKGNENESVILTDREKAFEASGDQVHVEKPSRRKDQSSWIDRSLSSRSKKRAEAVGFSSSVVSNPKANQRILSPNACRIKRVSAPANFVKEQRNYFAEVDAFELEEETPPSKERWLNDFSQRDTVIPGVEFYSRGLLQAVDEDTPEKKTSLHISPQKDILRHILETPYLDKTNELDVGSDTLKAQDCKPALEPECFSESFTRGTIVLSSTQKYCNLKVEYELNNAKQEKCDCEPLTKYKCTSYGEEKLALQNSQKDDLHHPRDFGKTAFSLAQNDYNPEAECHFNAKQVNCEFRTHGALNNGKPPTLNTAVGEDKMILQDYMKECLHSPCDAGKSTLSSPENCHNSEADCELIQSKANKVLYDNGSLRKDNSTIVTTDDVEEKINVQNSRKDGLYYECDAGENAVSPTQICYNSKAICEPALSDVNKVNCEHNSYESLTKGNPTAEMCTDDEGELIMQNSRKDGLCSPCDAGMTAVSGTQNYDISNSKSRNVSGYQEAMDEKVPHVLNLKMPECKPIYDNAKQVKHEYAPCGTLIKGNTTLSSKHNCCNSKDKASLHRETMIETVPYVINLDTPECKLICSNAKQVKCEYNTYELFNINDMMKYESMSVISNQRSYGQRILDTLEPEPVDVYGEEMKCRFSAGDFAIDHMILEGKDRDRFLVPPQCTISPRQELEVILSSGDSKDFHLDLSSLTQEMNTLNVQECQGQDLLEQYDNCSPERLPDDELSFEHPLLERFLKKCGQKAPLKLREAITEFSDLKEIQKLGEGTYGEAFKGSNVVFKIVPMDGDFLVNGETQKTSTEMYTETLLSLTLNRLRVIKERKSALQLNICNNFIETKMVRVCEGVYNEELIHAWEEWDDKHGSENDHPKLFPADQLYVIFVLADGGKDLESFSVKSYDVAKSILMQVTAALAVAEEDCEFEHRDLHWGNILVSQSQDDEVHFKLDGKDMLIKAHGVFVQIIDFTLSRLHTGNEVLFADLSADPALFEGCKGDAQAETYRKMLNVTKGQWGSSFFKTNCHWLHYLVEILVTKKLAAKKQKLHQGIRELRAFKKRIMSYDSAKTCLQEDEIFESIRR